MARKIEGFTLFEVLIALGLVMVLVSIAYPTYRHMLLKTRLNQTEIALFRIAAALEDYHSLNSTYKEATLAKLHFPGKKAGYFYSLESLSDEAYLIKATPEGNQVKEPCGVVWVNSEGARGAEREGCWSGD